MLTRLLKFDYLLPVLLLAGVSQYSVVAYSALVSGSVVLFQIDSAELISAGPLRYIKDIVIACLAIAWIIALPKLYLLGDLVRLIRFYTLWVVTVIMIGVIPFIVGYSPLFFLPSGLRWILLLHAAFGVFILSSSLVVDQNRHKLIFRFLVSILLINGYVTFLQFVTASSLEGLAYGRSRLTGLFSNAGVAANFAIVVSLLAAVLDGIGQKKRILVCFFCMILALSSGTRYATGATFIILLGQFWELIGVSNNKFKLGKKVVFIPFAIGSILIGYQALINQVDRGDAISQQFEEGGRVANFRNAVNLFASADVGELAVGRGLGVGTNTAIGSLLGQGFDPEIYRFNRLADNSFITGMFQFGFFGSLVFWFGLWRFMLFCKPKKPSSRMKPRFFVTSIVILMVVVLGSPFEQYFLMVAFAVSLGSVYWSDRITLHKRQVSSP